MRSIFPSFVIKSVLASCCALPSVLGFAQNPTGH